MIAVPTVGAQSLEASKPPAPVQTIDRFSIDLKSGEFIGVSRVLPIGPLEAPALSYAPVDINYNSDLGTPTKGWVMYYACGTTIQHDCYRNYYVIRMGNKSATFHDDNSTHMIAATGDHLFIDGTGLYVLDTQGTRWDYNGGSIGAGPENIIQQTGSLTKVTYRDGRTLTYSYSSQGLTIKSNLGYALVIGSGAQDVKMVNLAIDYCDTQSCALTTSWPTYLKDAAGIHDPVGNVTQITTSSASQTSTSTISRPGGLVQTINKANRLLYSDGWTSHAAFPVVSYSDQFGSASYTYQGDINRNIVGTTASYSDATSVSRESNHTNGTEIWRDELSRSTTSTYSLYDMQPWSYGNQFALLGSIRTPEQLTQTIGYTSYGAVSHVGMNPKPNSGLAAISATATYHDCANQKLCHQPSQSVDANGAQTDYTYNPISGMLLTKTAPPDANGVRQETRYTYEQREAIYKQSSGATPTASGSPIWVLVATSTCRTLPGAACVGSADEVRTLITYDSSLRPTATTMQSGDGTLSRTTSQGYDAIGNVIWTDGPSSGDADRAYFFWDLARQKIGEISPDPDGTGPLPRVAKRYSYNPDSLLSSTEVGTTFGIGIGDLNAMIVHMTSTSTFDARGLKLTDRVSGGMESTLTQYSYTARGLLECTAVRMNPAAFNSLPASACTLGPEGANGPDRITRNSYDAAGQLLKVIRGYNTSVQIDDATYTYTLDGLRQTLRDANGNLASMTYNGLNRQVRWDFPSKTVVGQVSGSDYEAYEYDANGNRTLLRKRDGRTISFGYDALGRMTSKSYPQGGARPVYYAYDLRGLQTAARFDGVGGGDAVLTTYDALGQITSSTTSMNGISRTLSFLYGPSGIRTRVTHPDGAWFQYEQDNLDRETRIFNQAGAQLTSLSYNSNAQLVSKFGGLQTFAYDGVGRLASSAISAGLSYDVVSNYGYNPASQITSRYQSNAAYAFSGYVNVTRGYAVNGLNQYLSAGPASFAYDANGNPYCGMGRSYRGFGPALMCGII